MTTPTPGRTEIPESITTPEKVESRIGTLEFKDGYPIGDTTAKISDELDYLHGVEAFMNSIHGVSTYAIRKGLMESGVKENEFVLFSELMDCKSLFLTPNADTVYYIGVLDLSKGPLIFESPPDALGVIDDMWFRWVTDFGNPGADRGKGGKYLLVPPEYDGLLPEGGFYIRKSRTFRVLVLGRSFLVDNDPAPTVALIKNTMKVYPYTPGGAGTSIGSFLTGQVRSLGALKEESGSPRFVEGTGLVMNTIPPNDFGHYEMLNALVQMEPAEALDPELAGQFAAIGIVKGKEFAPDARLRKILERAVAVGNASARMFGMGGRLADHFYYYGESSAWWNMLFLGGYKFLNPPPMITEDGIKPFPNSGARKLHARTGFFYTATGITPAMCMRLTGVGSQYLLANVDSNRQPFDGSKTYKITLPKDIPAARFWSFTVYDNQTRSLLPTDQKLAGVDSTLPGLRTNPDGSVTVWFGPTAPGGEQANWVQTVPGRGYNVLLRLYGPLEPWFNQTWKPGDLVPQP